MLALIFRFASYVFYLVMQFSIGLRLLARLRQRDGFKWGVPSMLIAVPYGAATIGISFAIQQGAPGWLNLLVLWFGVLCIAFLVNGPISLVLLAVFRIRESLSRTIR